MGALGLIVSAAGLASAVKSEPPAAGSEVGLAVEMNLGPLAPHVTDTSFSRDDALEDATLRLQELIETVGPVPDGDRALEAFLSLAFDEVDYLTSADGRETEYVYVWKIFEGEWVQICLKRRSLVLLDEDQIEPLRLDVSWTMPL